MGMDVNMLACVRALAENRIQDAKKYAVCCCANDNTKKNESQVRRCKNLLLNGPNMIELPANLNGLLRMEDVSGFHAERYYLGKTQWDLFEKIKRGVAVTLKLREYGIPYKNSTLIYGVPGTGKTEFARYVAYSLGIPYAYINFSFLIDSFMGNTSKNIQRVFDFCKGQKCVLMLDEIDCIGCLLISKIRRCGCSRTKAVPDPECMPSVLDRAWSRNLILMESRSCIPGILTN